MKRGWTGRGSAALLAALAVVPPGHAQPTAEDEATFDAALPPLEETAPAVAPPSPAVPPLSADVPALADPELSAPLPPLATFDPTPPAIDAVTDEAAPEVRYSYSVTGLSGALDYQFDELSALREARGRGANAAQVSARAEQDEQLAEQLLRADGYYDAVATTTIAPVPDQPDHLTVTITATPGPRYMFGDIRITGAAPEPAGIARDALGLDSGDPIVAARVEAGEANVSLRLPQQGYPFVEVGARDILLDEATRRGDYTLPITAGPKAVFGGFRVEGDPVFDPDHIDLLARFRPGQLYDSRRVEDLKQAMIATALFSNVAVEPVRTGTTTEDGLERVDLAVTQTEGPARQLAASAGYGTGQGIKLTGSWTHRNLFPPEGAVMVAAVAGTQEQSLSGTFRRSNAGRRDRAFQAGASIGRQNFDAFNAYTVGLNASIARVSTPLWQKRWTYTLGAEVLASAETRFVESRQARTRNTYFIAALPGQVGYDRSDSLLDPTRGFRLSARISPEAQQQGGRSDFYARTLFEASGYYPVTDALVIAGRTRVGSILGAPRDRIAPSRRLYAGGGGSVRGFGFQELGPKDIDNKPIGGRSLTEFAIEARYRFGDFGIVPFFDAGRVGEGSTPGISDLRYGAGIGGRYYTNFGPMRVDIAMPLGRRPGESKVALYISIGQAF